MRSAAQEDVARGRLLHAGEHADERRLAGAGRADDGEELALGDVEIDAVDGVEAAEGLGERDLSFRIGGRGGMNHHNHSTGAIRSSYDADLRCVSKRWRGSPIAIATSPRMGEGN